MFIVGNEAVPEAEWWAMVPEGVSVHAARVTAPAPWAVWDASHAHVELVDDLHRGASQFAAMRLSAVVVGHTSSSLMGGMGWDEAVVARLAEVLPDEVTVTTNGLDNIAALRHLDLERPFVVFPPWFGDEAVSAGYRYLSGHGFRVSGQKRHDPGRRWRDLPPSELYRHGMGFQQDVEALYAEVRSACPDDADGVLIAGTGFRCVGIIEALEEDLNRPVVTANQASLWRCLRLSGVRTPVSGYGTLLRA